MFAADVVDLDPAETLAAAARARSTENEAGVDRLILAAHFADLHPGPASIPGDRTLPGGERSMIYGGPGCPGIAEFSVAEYGVVLGVSPESAAKDIGQALALRHRLPRTWAAVLARTATAWKARLIATACLPLSIEAAAIVDRRVVGIVDSVGPIQLRNIVKAATWQADPEAARLAAEQRARERGVWAGRSDEHGTTPLFVKAATGDVIRINATITQIADALAALGDPDPLQPRKAKAIGILADPALAHQLLQVAQYLATHQTASTPTPAQSPTAVATPPKQPTESRPTEPDRFTHPARPTHTTRPTEAGQPTEPQADTLRRTHTPPRADTPTPTHTPPRANAPTAAPLRANDEPHLAAPVGHPTPAQPTQPALADELVADGNVNLKPANPAYANTGISAQRSTQPDTANAPQPDHLPDHPDPSSNLFLADEPHPDAEADRDTPHPSHPAHPLDAPPPRTTTRTPAALAQTLRAMDAATYTGMDPASRHALTAKLAAIKHAADSTTADPTGPKSRTRPGRTKLYIHRTDETLLAGHGVTRVEGFGPVYAPRLAELFGHDQLIIQPVIDLNDHLNVNAYEIPRRIREHVKLTYPVEQFPYGPGETTNNTDLDHVAPYDPTGPPGQTSTTNLRPLRRLSHRVKTHAGWKVRPIDDHALEWTTRHGYIFRVDHTGTHPVSTPPDRIQGTGRDQP
ncbi:hypothetical protein GCM10009789_82730 [Kribbella sancticallisti]|uniref:DUF222 domain-containing protein n=1 Tax=Kribbella sancticallisti TaxID=460087 RepID=A0ABN2EVN1_9ACTN